jgi:hypothetical protein
MVIWSTYIIWKKTDCPLTASPPPVAAAARQTWLHFAPCHCRRDRQVPPFLDPPPPGLLPAILAAVTSGAPPPLPRCGCRRDTSLHPHTAAALAGTPPSSRPSAAAATGHPASILASSPPGVLPPFQVSVSRMLKQKDENHFSIIYANTIREGILWAIESTMFRNSINAPFEASEICLPLQIPNVSSNTLKFWTKL